MMENKKKQRVLISLPGLEVPFPTGRKLVQELVTNGISSIIAIMVSLFLKQFFAVKGIHNGWGLFAKKSKLLVDKDTYSWLNWIIVFVIGLFIFTFTEKIIEAFYDKLDRRKNLDHQSPH